MATLSATGAQLVVRALEEVGVRLTFGIPGVHNTEIYDELDRSEHITPILVTSEFSAGFMADAVSRLTDSIGTLVVVPAAGVTHAASGMGEAMLDGIPMLVITGGVRNETPFRHQLHQVDQMELARGLTKGAYRVTTHEDVMPTIFAAHRLATSGVPGPVLVEFPVDLQMARGKVRHVPEFVPAPAASRPPRQQIDKAVALLAGAKNPVIYVGWGARGARNLVVELAERLEAPVTTSLQGLASFPHDHPLHAGFGFGPAAVPAGRNAFSGHDVMLAVGVRFAEIATGSFGIDPPAGLIHVDIDPEVFDANYPARVALCGDARDVIGDLVKALPYRDEAVNGGLRARIAADKAAYAEDFAASGDGSRVNPARFFAAVRAATPADAIATLDDGNHTFLTAELWPVSEGGDLISPTDYNAMGYAVPAGVAAKLALPEREVLTFVGDGCFRMTGLELATATAHGAGLVVYVFNDGELAQIAQAQQLPYNRKTCTVLPEVAIEGLARASGAEYVVIERNDQLDDGVARARALAAQGRPVVVDVRMDYSRKTTFTQAILTTNFLRFAPADAVRIAARAGARRLPGRG